MRIDLTPALTTILENATTNYAEMTISLYSDLCHVLACRRDPGLVYLHDHGRV
jgi:hypothetical protein